MNQNFFQSLKRKKNPKHWDILNKPENLHIKPELKSYMLKNEQKIGIKVTVLIVK